MSPGTPREAGVSIMEMLLSLSLCLVLATITMAIVVSTRSLFDADQQRVSVSQQLRSGIDLVGQDIRLAGERLPADMPAVFITDGGASPDTLVLRRNILDAVLPLCDDLIAGTNQEEVYVARLAPPIPQGCDPVPDTDGDGVPDNLGAWRAHRLLQGGEVQAYAYDPVARLGEFFTFDAEDAALLYLRRSDGEEWLNDYDADDQPRVYILEQRTYGVTTGVLRYLVNDVPGSEVNLIADVLDFQARAFMPGGPVNVLNAADAWTAIESIETTLSLRRAYRGRLLDRSATSRFFPRNALSR